MPERGFEEAFVCGGWASSAGNSNHCSCALLVFMLWVGYGGWAQDWTIPRMWWLVTYYASNTMLCYLFVNGRSRVVIGSWKEMIYDMCSFACNHIYWLDHWHLTLVGAWGVDNDDNDDDDDDDDDDDERLLVTTPLSYAMHIVTIWCHHINEPNHNIKLIHTTHFQLSFPSSGPTVVIAILLALHISPHALRAWNPTIPKESPEASGPNSLGCAEEWP